MPRRPRLLTNSNLVWRQSVLPRGRVGSKEQTAKAWPYDLLQRFGPLSLVVFIFNCSGFINSSQKAKKKFLIYALTNLAALPPHRCLPLHSRPRNKRAARWGKITKTTSGQNAISRCCSPDTRKSHSELMAAECKMQTGREWGKASWKQFALQKGTKLQRGQRRILLIGFAQTVQSRQTKTNEESFFKALLWLAFIECFSVPWVHSILSVFLVFFSIFDSFSAHQNVLCRIFIKTRKIVYANKQAHTSYLTLIVRIKNYTYRLFWLCANRK